MNCVDWPDLAVFPAGIFFQAGVEGILFRLFDEHKLLTTFTQKYARPAVLSVLYPIRACLNPATSGVSVVYSSAFRRVRQSVFTGKVKRQLLSVHGHSIWTGVGYLLRRIFDDNTGLFSPEMCQGSTTVFRVPQPRNLDNATTTTHGSWLLIVSAFRRKQLSIICFTRITMFRRSTVFRDPQSRRLKNAATIKDGSLLVYGVGFSTKTTVSAFTRMVL